MVGDNKFFFEEDVTEIGTGVKTEEQADIFGEALAEVGLKSDLDSMAPKEVEVITNDVVTSESSVLRVEYGIVNQDYVLHLTPIHPNRNLTAKHKLQAAIKEVITELNKAVPFDLRVDIHLPQEDWQIKATSFIIRGAASAWNFDRHALDSTVIPAIQKKVTDICVKP